jgi:hypothetical protein
MSETARPSPNITPGNELALAGLTTTGGMVGERRSYSLQPGYTEYELWPFSTIAWVAEKGKYQARAIMQHKTTFDAVVFNSWHEDFADAERAIDLLSNSLRGVGERRVYFISGEIIAVSTSPPGSGSHPSTTEVLVEMWSMQLIANS